MEQMRENGMKGKVCLVTGATSGIGEVAARELARMGAAVVVVGRSSQKCEATLARICQETGSKAVTSLLANLSSMKQVRRLAEQFQESFDRLDVLVNNAGAFFVRRQLSPEGLEMTFALNHLSYFLLTNLLLDTLKATPQARIVNVSSNSHQGHILDFNDLQLKKGYSGIKAYGRSKLANVMFTYELARCLEGTGVTANVLNPGFVATDIWTLKNRLLRFLVKPVMNRIALTPEQGAENILFLAASSDVDGVTGKYFRRMKPAPSTPFSYDEEAARHLWVLSEQLVNGTLSG
jgi:retinol dehydrogenase 12